MELFIRVLECIQDRVACIPRASSSSSLVAKSCLTLATPQTVAYQASLPMGFSRQEYWSGLPCPSPGDLLSAGIKPRSPALLAGSLPSEPPGKTRTEKGKWKRSAAAQPFAISEHKGQREDCKHFQREKTCHQQRVMQSLFSDRRYQSTLEGSRAFKCLRENSFYLEFCTK